MFDWVLNTPLNTITIFFPDIPTLKFMTFRIFFQRLTFPTNTYLPEAKAYLELKRTSTMELFRVKFFFSKIQKETPVPESYFNKVTDRYLSSKVVPTRYSKKKVF